MLTPTIPIIEDGPESSHFVVFLAHGAGAGKGHPWMQSVARGLASKGLRVIRFDFPYMEKRTATGVKYPPDRMPALLDRFERIASKVPSERRIVAGKSMGGRVAVRVAQTLGAAKLLVFGFPMHPLGKPELLRIDELKQLKLPSLIIQGERDPMGSPALFNQLADSLPVTLRVRLVPDGDHSFKPRKASGRTWEQNVDEAVAWAAKFCLT